MADQAEQHADYAPAVELIRWLDESVTWWAGRAGIQLQKDPMEEIEEEFADRPDVIKFARTYVYPVHIDGDPHGS